MPQCLPNLQPLALYIQLYQYAAEGKSACIGARNEDISLAKRVGAISITILLAASATALNVFTTLPIAVPIACAVGALVALAYSIVLIYKHSVIKNKLSLEPIYDSLLEGKWSEAAEKLKGVLKTQYRQGIGKEEEVIYTKSALDALDMPRAYWRYRGYDAPCWLSTLYTFAHVCSFVEKVAQGNLDLTQFEEQVKHVKFIGKDIRGGGLTDDQMHYIEVVRKILNKQVFIDPAPDMIIPKDHRGLSSIMFVDLMICFKIFDRDIPEGPMKNAHLNGQEQEFEDQATRYPHVQHFLTRFL